MLTELGSQLRRIFEADLTSRNALWRAAFRPRRLVNDPGGLRIPTETFTSLLEAFVAFA